MSYRGGKYGGASGGNYRGRGGMNGSRGSYGNNTLANWPQSSVNYMDQLASKAFYFYKPNEYNYPVGNQYNHGYNGMDHDYGGSRYPKKPVSPWENGQPPHKNLSKRTLLPTPPPHTTPDIISSVNHLYQMGVSEKQLVNIVQAVVTSENRLRNQSYGNDLGPYGTRNHIRGRNPSNLYYNAENRRYSYNPTYYHNNNNNNMRSRLMEKPKMTKRSSSSKLTPKSPNSTTPKLSKELMNIPKEALYCHICDIDNFTSRESFLTHLQGKSHASLTQAHNSKNSAILQMLRANSKIANMKRSTKMQQKQLNKTRSSRNIKSSKSPAIKAGVKKYSRSQSWAGETTSVGMCNVCMIDINVNLKNHVKSWAHKQVHQFLNVKCCGKWYGQQNNGGRKEIEEHKLTLTHLNNVYKEKLESEKNMDKSDESEEEEPSGEGEKEDGEEGKNWLPFLERLQKEEEEKGHHKLESLPPYDAMHMMGLSCIKNRLYRHCLACNLQFGLKKRKLQNHCRSAEHYENVTKYLQGIEAKQLQKKENEQKNSKEENENEENFDEAVEKLSSNEGHESEDDSDDEKEEEEEQKSNDMSAGKVAESLAELTLKETNEAPVSWSDASELNGH